MQFSTYNALGRQKTVNRGHVLLDIFQKNIVFLYMGHKSVDSKFFPRLEEESNEFFGMRFHFSFDKYSFQMKIVLIDGRKLLNIQCSFMLSFIRIAHQMIFIWFYDFLLTFRFHVSILQKKKKCFAKMQLSCTPFPNEID